MGRAKPRTSLMITITNLQMIDTFPPRRQPYVPKSQPRGASCGLNHRKKDQVSLARGVKTFQDEAQEAACSALTLALVSTQALMFDGRRAGWWTSAYLRSPAHLKQSWPHAEPHTDWAMHRAPIEPF